jgi:UDP-N-acetylglucosamine acyltransferase
MNIHNTAIIDKDTDIHPSVNIGAFSIIEKGVSIGANTKIFPHVHIMGNTKIGENNQIYNGTVIGHYPQDTGFDPDKDVGIIIGNNNIIREYNTIHLSTKDGLYTRIGDSNFLMVGAHVAHDCIIEDETIIVNNTSLGGHVYIEKKAFISGHVGIHQYCRIGAYSMIGSCEKISQDVVPFMTVNDFPARTTGINLVGLKRAGFDSERRKNIQKAYKIVFRGKSIIPKALEKLDKEFEHPDIKYIKRFIQNSQKNGRGILK